jgi:hypothetical protein
MNHELFRMNSFAEMEKHLADNIDSDFTLSGADLTVLIFLTKCITLNDLHRDLEAVGVAQDLTQEIIQRIKDKENGKSPPPIH